MEKIPLLNSLEYYKNFLIKENTKKRATINIHPF